MKTRCYYNGESESRGDHDPDDLSNEQKFIEYINRDRNLQGIEDE